jgi:hypothetical protein
LDVAFEKFLHDHFSFFKRTFFRMFYSNLIKDSPRNLGKDSFAQNLANGKITSGLQPGETGASRYPPQVLSLDGHELFLVNGSLVETVQDSSIPNEFSNKLGQRRLCLIIRPDQKDADNVERLMKTSKDVVFPGASDVSTPLKNQFFTAKTGAVRTRLYNPKFANRF